MVFGHVFGAQMDDGDSQMPIANAIGFGVMVGVWAVNFYHHSDFASALSHDQQVVGPSMALVSCDTTLRKPGDGGLPVGEDIGRKGLAALGPAGFSACDVQLAAQSIGADTGESTSLKSYLNVENFLWPRVEDYRVQMVPKDLIV
jgi:hypothetical protein